MSTSASENDKSSPSALRSASSKENESAAQSGRFQFGLTGLFVATTICAVFVGLWNLSGGEVLACGFLMIALSMCSFIPDRFSMRCVFRSFAATAGIALVAFWELASGYGQHIAGMGAVPGPPSASTQRLALAILFVLGAFGLYYAFRGFSFGSVVERCIIALPGLLHLAFLGFVIYGLVF